MLILAVLVGWRGVLLLRLLPVGLALSPPLPMPCNIMFRVRFGFPVPSGRLGS